MLDQPIPSDLREVTKLPASPGKPSPTSPRPPSRVRRVFATAWAWRVRILALIAVLLGLGLFTVPLVFGPVVVVDPVIRADYVQTVVASGHVEAPNRINIGSQIVGIVAEVPVVEGQTVQSGDVLVQLDDHEARAAVVATEGAVAQAEARLRQLRELTLPSAEEALKQAQASLVNAQQAHNRAAILARDAYGTRSALDDATKTLDVASAQVRSAEFQVYTNRPGGSDYTMAETQLRQAEANLVTAQSRLSYTIIKAPVAGVLIARNVERGYVVQPANVLMKLSPAGDTQLIVDADEKNLGSLRLGQHALASADAFASQNFPAEVVYINPGVDIDRATVEVKLTVRDPPAYLIQDMTVSVDIEVARHNHALVLPTADIRDRGTSSPSLLVAEGGHAKRKQIKLGLVDIGKVEILDGVQEAALVIPITSAVGEGDRLRARPARELK
jgi:HlyD family secretion protein